MSDINTWLESLGLAKYQQIFAENDIGTDILAELNDADLKELGVSLGDRKRLLKAIDALAPTVAEQRRFTTFLLWYGVEETVVPESISPSLSVSQKQPQPSSQQNISPNSPSNNAERRQLTVMFCDLVGSTALSAQLDPEDLRDLLQAYQSTCVEVIQGFDGFIARYMGDGILVYFGYPQASEFDAERALRSALGIVDAMQRLSADKKLSQGVELAVRIGLATGVVVVGDLIGEGVSEERNVVGETPNLAARLQSLAKPNGIVISSVTKDLAGDRFVYDDLGMHELKGISGHIKAWAVQSEREADEDELIEPPMLALIGRDEEIGLLRRAWTKSLASTGQVVLISGEPGIGKSRLVETIGREIKRDGYTRMTLSCSPYHTNSALYPMIQFLQRLLGWRRELSSQGKLTTIERALSDYRSLPDNSVPLLATLMSLTLPEERYPPLTLSPQQQKQQTLDMLVAWINEAAEKQPMLWVWEDLHWADPSTLELLNLVIEQCPTVPIFNLFTFRTDFTPPWPMRSHMTLIALNRLEPIEIEAMIARHTGDKALPVEVVQHIVKKADGIPLYVDELSKMIVTADFLRDVGDRYELTGTLSSVAIPATLQDSLMARLDRLPSVREVAQLGAVLGREFSYEMLQAITALDESALQKNLTRLVEEELLYQRGRPPQARYIFKHALIQDVAYQSLLKRTRQQYHRKVAELLESRFPERVEIEPELVAHHYTQADLAEPAITYWHRAGLLAYDHTAHQEAMVHLKTGLDLLFNLPESDSRNRQELALQKSLGSVLLNMKGYGEPEVETTYLRARTLCQQLDDTQELFPVLFGLWRFYTSKANLQLARQLAEECLELAKRSGEIHHHTMAQSILGTTCLWMGDSLSASDYLQECSARYNLIKRYNPLFRIAHDPGVGARTFSAFCLWLQGYPEQALQCQRDALALAKQLDHPITYAFALTGSSFTRFFLRDKETVYDIAGDAMTFSSEQGFAFWLAANTLLRNWAVVDQQTEDAVVQMHRAILDWRATGGEIQIPMYLALLAEGHAALGQLEAGLDAIEEALAVIQSTGQNWWKAEVYRCKGELLLLKTTPDVSLAETCFQQALDIARQQQAKSLELRAATSMARLWQSQEKFQDAYDLLAPVYNWFTEGFDIADLKDAKALLDELSSSF